MRREEKALKKRGILSPWLLSPSKTLISSSVICINEFNEEGRILPIEEEIHILAHFLPILIRDVYLPVLRVVWLTYSAQLIVCFLSVILQATSRNETKYSGTSAKRRPINTLHNTG